MAALIIARHGESEYSRARLANGDPSVPVPLTPEGVEEARSLGREIAADPIEMCITSRFPRARQTADAALEGRSVRRSVDARWNDIVYGDFEGKPLDDFHRWAQTHELDEVVPGGTESRLGVVRRCHAALSDLTRAPEELTLVVCHELLVTYVLSANERRPPPPLPEEVGKAKPHHLSASELERAVAFLGDWLATQEASRTG